MKNGTNDEKPVFREDLNKIRKLGIWKDPEDLGSAKSPYALNICRGIMAVSWVATVGGLVVVGYAAPVALVFWAPVAIAMNWGIQKGLGWIHNQRFEATFSEIRREMKQAGSLQAGVAWAGVMHKFLQEHKPIMIFPNQTKLWDFQESNSMDAVLRQLRQAAQYGSDKLGNRPDNSATPFFRDPFFNDMLSQNDHALDNYHKRCLQFAHNSAKWANPLPLVKRFIFGK